jgi:NADH:ubiquinone oxidoreductase subunit 3 (subunit A)
MDSLAAYALLFLAVGAAFILVNLLLGKLIRPARPDAEKGTIYECGEPTIGSAWVQFDLRFYVVALLFVIFDVEVAFFFPWAVVFGKANEVAAVGPQFDDLLKKPGPKAAARFRELGQKQVALAKQDRELPEPEKQELSRLEGEFQRAVEPAARFRELRQKQAALAKQDQELPEPEKQELSRLQAPFQQGADAYRQMGERAMELVPPRYQADKQRIRDQLAAVTPDEVARLVELQHQQTQARAKGAGLPRAEQQELEGLEKTYGLAANALKDGRGLGWLAFWEILVFFGVLLVGFAYLWQRGDLAWVRSLADRQAAAAPPAPSPLAATKELTAVGK